MIGHILRQRYRIIQKLGAGGFGETYLAEDLDIPVDPKPKCVVKRLQPQVMQPEVLRLFENEAKTLYNLGQNHDRIPKLFAYFEQKGEFYLIQEFIDGQDLEKELTPGKKLSEGYVIKLLRDVLEVLAFVHQNKVIHRDIKPANIMRRRDGKLILIDFGAVKEVGTVLINPSGQTSRTLVIGTPGYMPSEQALGKPKPQSDIYALGIMAIQALTGIPPHLLPEDNQGELNWQNHAAVTSKELAEILTKMVRYDFRERYADATEILEALNQALGEKVFQFEVVTVNRQGQITQRQQKEATYFTQELGNGITLDMVAIPGGNFLMGIPKTEENGRINELPQHKVSIKPFFIGKYPVTQVQWQAVAGLPHINRNLNPEPSYFKGNNRPVEQIPWYDAVEFCDRLSQYTGRSYRLPSEAEWEYAARAGTTTPFHFGETITSDLANYNANYIYGTGVKGDDRKQTTEIGSFGVANAFGLYDIHGNIWEWCLDDWHDDYKGAPTDGSPWFDNDIFYQKQTRVILRGGSWYSNPEGCRSAYRFKDIRDLLVNNIGFRVVCELGEI